MWKALHQLAIPERLYRLCGCWIPWLAALSALLLVIGLGWGFGFAPADYQQGESYRIMYLHVPAAMWSMGLYLAMAVAAFVGVVWQIKMADLAIAALAPVGAVCTLVALVSGAAWGKPMWGTWWIWDARLTSELVLLFLYAGSSPCGTPLTTAGWPGARRGSLCWSGWSICPSFITRSTGGTPCTRARPTCSKPSTQACVCRCGSASLPSSRCRSP
ncbi:cytochrome c biogenesis protein CcsA [Klebsiella pneumoniae]|uniref:cytochrome c biogenesis protein CcsA n=1 Tax=Klebsiella pneumoniae TaxID=573 RepID=UPI00095ED3CA|nr:cytochrome c biogenesis protein CcsA [Klebsiella pneumoniae]RNP30569.1 heme ABC transporter permease [Klebsiella pneumoniae]